MEAKLFLAAVFLTVLLGCVASEHQIKNNDDARIFGGSKIDISSAPYMASIYVVQQTFSNGTTTGITCGGSILRRNVILTAAHCNVDKDQNKIFSASQFAVLVGSNTKVTNTGGTKHTVKRVFVHPKYRSGVNFFYDVGLLELNNDVTLNNRVRLVNLAGRTDRPKTGADVFVTGYGKNPDNPTTKNLYQVHLDVIAATQCSKEIKSGTASENEQHFICAKAPNKNHCKGDSGGPLHDASTNRQVGIVSNGYPDCTAGGPSVFCRVADVVDFIESVIGQTIRPQGNEGTNEETNQQTNPTPPSSTSFTLNPLNFFNLSSFFSIS